MSKRRGIFCLEGDWWNDLNRSSTVKPVLKLLCQVDSKVTFVHRDVGTLVELEHYLSKWCQKGRAHFPILYLAFHGEPGMLLVGDGRSSKSQFKLDDLADRLEGRCKGKLIHFGSCGTLDIDERHIQRVLRRTEAAGVTGFRATVDWLKSSAFEALLFEIFLRGGFSLAGMRRIERAVERDIGSLARDLKFRIVIRKDKVG